MRLTITKPVISIGLWLADRAWARLLICAALFVWAAMREDIHVMSAFLAGMVFAFVMCLGISWEVANEKKRR